MKAYLLAAGVGTRLRPLTDLVPKCLVPVGGEPILGIWFRLLARAGVTEVLLNTHHLGDQVQAYVRARAARGALPRVTLFHEPVLLGSAGTVAANRAFVRGERRFLVIYADNLTDMDLRDFVAFHDAHRSDFTTGLFETPEPRQCGIATLDAHQRIVAFQEKPERPTSTLANAGLYLATPSLFDLIPPNAYTDFGFDVLPRLVGRMYGYRIPGFYSDIGTPARLAAARTEWARRGQG